MNFEKYYEMIDQEQIPTGYKIDMLRNICDNKSRSNALDSFLFGVIIGRKQARSRVIYKRRGWK